MRVIGSKFNYFNVRAIYADRISGMGLSDLAKRYGCSYEMVRRICTGRSWPELYARLTEGLKDAMRTRKWERRNNEE